MYMYMDVSSRQKNGGDYKPVSNLSMAVNQNSVEGPQQIYPSSLPPSYMQSPLPTLDPPEEIAQEHFADPLHHNSHNEQIVSDLEKPQSKVES